VTAGQHDGGGGEVGGCVAATFGGDVSAWVRPTPPLFVGLFMWAVMVRVQQLRKAHNTALCCGPQTGFICFDFC
jgi:hypothetical protein